MPSSYLRKIAEERDMSMRSLEAIYERAKTLALKKFDEESPQFYPYATGIFKRMLGVSKDEKMQALASAMYVTPRVRSLEECFTTEGC